MISMTFVIDAVVEPAIYGKNTAWVFRDTGGQSHKIPNPPGPAARHVTAARDRFDEECVETRRIGIPATHIVPLPGKIYGGAAFSGWTRCIGPIIELGPAPAPRGATPPEFDFVVSGTAR
jgi:hypothetical protein